MTFRHLEAFVQVALRGGFTRAAEALFLTQPTISGQIKELEEELGVSLFHRLPRVVELTEAGGELLPRARALLEARDHLLERAASYRGLLWGRLEVHASTIPGEYLLPPVLAGFKRTHPEVRVSLRIHDSSEVLRLVAGGEASLGVAGERQEGLGLEYLPLWSDRLGLYAGRGFPVERPVSSEGLADLPMIVREEGSGTRQAVEAFLRGKGIFPEKLRVVAEFGSTAAVKEAVKAGIGVAFLSDAAVTCEVEAGVLIPIVVSGMASVERGFYAAWDPQRVLSPAVRAFLEVLQREAAEAGQLPTPMRPAG